MPQHILFLLEKPVPWKDYHSWKDMSLTAYVIYICSYIMLHINDESWVSKLKEGQRGWGSIRWRCDMLWEAHRANNRLALESTSHLIDVHAVVTGQRASRCQVVGTEEGWYDAVLVDLPDCGAIDKINQAILVHSDACWCEGVKGEKKRKRGRKKKRLVITGKHGGYAASLLAWLSGQNTMDTCVKLAFPLFRSLQKAQPSIIQGLLFCY